MNEHNLLARQYTMRSLLHFAFPSIAMMIFMGLYTIVDSVFISRMAGQIALAALNIVTPVISLIVGLGTMLATGGSAIIVRKLGSGQQDEARRDFTMLVLTTVIAGILIGITALVFIRPVIRTLGASNLLVKDAEEYLSTLLVFTPANMLQVFFSVFFIAAGRPKLGFTTGFCAGIVNALFDFIFMGPMKMGIRGAALATGMGYLIPVVFGLFFFLRNTAADLYFVPPRFNPAVLGESLFNGSSEMTGQLSSAVTTFLFNTIMMKYLQETGVAAITIIIYSLFLFSTFFIGFSMGVAPVFSYNYGSQNNQQLQRMFSLCCQVIAIISVTVFLGAWTGGPYLAAVFSPAGTEVYRITRDGFYIVPVAFLFCGFNIFASSLFTALSNGLLSALISLLRSLVFLSAGIVVLPVLFGIRGIWFAPVFAELGTFLIAVFLIRRERTKYRYLPVN
jgi:Na+-driven multidrug efflux pump